LKLFVLAQLDYFHLSLAISNLELLNFHIPQENCQSPSDIHKLDGLKIQEHILVMALYRCRLGFPHCHFRGFANFQRKRFKLKDLQFFIYSKRNQDGL